VEDEGVSKRIVGAAHFYATKWEFDIIKRMNPTDFEIHEIENNISSRQQEYSNVNGIQQLDSDSNLSNNLRRFIDLCGQLRFQLRWGNIRRVTLTSVLGHMLIVAILAYLFSLEIGACSKRCVNNFLTGLFHDLPEVLTRDIVSPVKGSVEGISDIVKEYEKEQMKDRIYRILPLEWHNEMRIFAEDEFSDLITINQQPKVVSSTKIRKQYNKDEFNPRDGSLVEACDDLAAFTEAYLAVRNGVTAEALYQTISDLKREYKNKSVAGINFGQIYADFD
jgi:putative hydrolase of HD superfamily